MSGDGQHIRIFLPAITHNPWHPAYVLTPEARGRVTKEIAMEYLRDLKAENPGQPVTVYVDGVPFAGFVPHEVRA